jgi:hypothetical protein
MEEKMGEGMRERRCGKGAGKGRSKGQNGRRRTGGEVR